MEDGHSNAGSKDYLVSLMFSHYDLNNNGLLEAQELSKVYYRSSYFFSILFYFSVFSPLRVLHFTRGIIQMIPARGSVSKAA